MSYQIVENTPDGFVVHTVDNAETALSMWYALDGEVSAIRNDQQTEILLTDLIAEVAANKNTGLPPKSRIEIEENEDLEVDEGEEKTRGYPGYPYPTRLPFQE